MTEGLYDTIIVGAGSAGCVLANRLSADPNRRVLLLETDRRMIVAGMKLARRIAATAPLSDLIESEFIPGEDVRSDGEMLAAARRHASTIFHPVGSCKMGGDPLAVVDERLRVLGVAGLCVADCSIMPTIVSGNTNASAIMIGEKCADMMLAD